MGRMRFRVAATIGAVVAVTIGTAQVAGASVHQQSPPDGGGYGHISASHQNIVVCDTKANNRGIRMEWTADDATGNVYITADANGSADGCGTANTGTYRVTSYKVCSSETGGGKDKCSAGEWIEGH